jgi:hypothetical protein
MVRRPRTDQLRLGRCTLRADPGVLTLRAEAADEEHLHQLQQRIADRLEQVGRRDRLTVTWTLAPARRGAAAEPAHRRHRGQREDAHMTDRSPTPDPDDDPGMVYDRESPPGMPRWVKVAGIIVAVVALLVVVMLLVGGGGGHGPQRHGGAGGQAPPSSVTAVHLPLLLAARS